MRVTFSALISHDKQDLKWYLTTLDKGNKQSTKIKPNMPGLYYNPQINVIALRNIVLRQRIRVKTANKFY